jgi:signal transduction histidine kinase
MFYGITPGQAIWCGRILHVGVTFIPALFYHFVCLLLDDAKARRLVKSIYAIAFTFLSLNLCGILIQGVTRNYFGFYSVGGKIYPFFSAYVAAIIFLSLFLILRAKKKADGWRKRQLGFLAFGTTLAILGGFSESLAVIGLQYYPLTQIPFYRFGSTTIGIYGLCVAYAIVRHRLMDIEVIVRRTLVFTGLLAFVFGIFSAVTFVARQFLGEHFRTNATFSYAVSIFVIVVSFDYLRNFLMNITDRYFFQKKYDYQRLLKDASRGMSRIKSLEHLLRLVIHFITMKMRVRNAGVMTKQNHSDVFVLLNQRGYAKNYFDYRLPTANSLIEYLQVEKEALDVERIKELMAYARAKSGREEKKRHYDYPAILRQMEELEAVCCVPSFLGHDLRNILVLGEKKSGDFYTEDDLNVLFTLAQESAIAIENARLYDEAVTKTHELERINEQLEYSKSLLMRALKETEIANKQLQDTQAQLIHEQKMATLGRLAASVGHEVNNPLTILSMNVSRAILKYRKNPDTKLSDVLELFDKMEQNIGRIKAVVNTLTGLLKRSEKGKFEPLSLKLILEETLPLVQFQTYLDNLSGTEVEFDIPGHLPLIRGDLERLQEVFLNLFINAYHAMEGKRNRKIFVSAIADPHNARQVAVHFQDNGSGMSDEVLKKAFTYGFTTKPPGRGSGMGLYMCKYIIELHGGEMHVQSKLGEGTTFTLTLPVSEETGMSGIGQEGAGRI